MRVCIGGTGRGAGTFFSTLRASFGLYLSKGSRRAPLYSVLAACAAAAVAAVSTSAAVSADLIARSVFLLLSFMFPFLRSGLLYPFPPARRRAPKLLGRGRRRRRV